MIDVHILTLPETDLTLLNECVSSVMADPINLSIVEGVDGHLGQGRADAIRKGKAAWVGWIDPDDVVIPGAYRRLLEISKKIPETPFLWANEEVWYVRPEDMYAPVNVEINQRPHHMHIIHRDMIDYDLIESTVSNFCPMLENMMNVGYHLDEVGYIWRRYHTSSCRIRKMDISSVKATSTI